MALQLEAQAAQRLTRAEAQSAELRQQLDAAAAAAADVQVSSRGCHVSVASSLGSLSGSSRRAVTGVAGLAVLRAWGHAVVRISPSRRASAPELVLRTRLRSHLRVPRPQAKLAKATSDAESARQQLSSTAFSEKALKARVKELEGQLARADQQLKQQRAAPPAAPPAAAPAAAQPAAGPPAGQPAAAGSAEAAQPAVDLGMLSLMEGQLGRLSELIRTRDAEVAQMRAALQVGPPAAGARLESVVTWTLASC